MVLTLRRAVIVSMLAEGVALLGAFTTLAVISRTRDAQEFGAYTLLTRLLAVLQPVCLLGAGVTLPRLIPRAPRKDAPRLIVAATLLVIAPLGAVALVSLSHPVNSAVLRDAAHLTSLSLLSLMLTGSVLHAVAYASLRGLLAYRSANALFALNMGVLPAIWALMTSGVTELAAALGISWIVVSGVALCACVRRVQRPEPSPWRLARAGAGRVPGEFALFGLTAVPPILVSHYDSVGASGTMSLAMTVLTTVGALVVPLSAVLLPHVSARLAAGEADYVRALLRRLCRLWLWVAPVLLLVVEVAVRSALPLVFGERGRAAVPLAHLLLLAAPGFALFVLLHSFVDAATARASTMLAAVQSFGLLLVLFVVLSLLGAPVQIASGVAAVASMWLLGLTVLSQALRAVDVDRSVWLLASRRLSRAGR